MAVVNNMAILICKNKKCPVFNKEFFYVKNKWTLNELTMEFEHSEIKCPFCGKNRFEKEREQPVQGTPFYRNKNRKLWKQKGKWY